MQFTTLLTSFALVKYGIAGYAIQDDYSASNFFGMFDFFTDSDPTHGYVHYVDQDTAQSGGMINTTSNNVYMGVDSSSKADSDGRKSVRLTSKAAYNEGLIILDLAHMPGSVCGSWPAFWMVGPSWPNNGEIDIIEGVNSQLANAMTLHTGPGCSIGSGGSFSGKITTQDCDVNAAGQGQNVGCSIDTDDDTTYGNGFNSASGGVYATEITSDAISVYHFPRASIPSDISSGSPDPSSWGQPLAQFSGGCDIASTFKSMNIVFDITFCGDWAGNVWSSDSTCSAKASTCTDYVQNNPSAFQDSYWSINSLKVFKSGGASTVSSEAQPSPSSSKKPVPATTLKTSTKVPTPTSSTTTTSEAAPVPQTTFPSSPAEVSTTPAASSPSPASVSFPPISTLNITSSFPMFTLRSSSSPLPPYPIPPSYSGFQGTRPSSGFIGGSASSGFIASSLYHSRPTTIVQTVYKTVWAAAEESLASRTPLGDVPQVTRTRSFVSTIVIDTAKDLPFDTSDAASTPQQGEPLQFGWFGSDSGGGIPVGEKKNKEKHRRHMERYIQAHARRHSHGHGLVL